jgi:hypothetical protein
MQSAQNQELKQAADYYAFKKTVQGKGNVNIALGIIGIVLGFFYTLINPINIILVLLGVLILVIGIWAKIRPTTSSLLFAGIGLCIMGAWNAVIVVINIIAFAADPLSGIGWSPVGIVWSWVQISLGVDVFNRYRRTIGTPVREFNNDWLKRVEETISPVIHGDPNKENDVIEFKKQTVWMYATWKGKLTHPYGMIAPTRGDDIFFVTPEEVEVVDKGKFRKVSKAWLIINGKTYKGTMTPQSITRLQYWKNPTKVIPA